MQGVTFRGQNILLRGRHSPISPPPMLGGILHIPNYYLVLDISILANILAMLSDVGDIGSDVHAHIPIN